MCDRECVYAFVCVSDRVEKGEKGVLGHCQELRVLHCTLHSVVAFDVDTL